MRKSQEEIRIEMNGFCNMGKPKLFEASARYMRKSASVMSLKGSAQRQKVMSSTLSHHALAKLPKLRKRFNEETMSVFTKQSKQKVIQEIVKEREFKTSQNSRIQNSRYNKSEIEIKDQNPVPKEIATKERIEDIKSEILSQAHSHKEISKKRRK